MVTSSPVESRVSPAPTLQNIVKKKRRSTGGSYGCVREVLHPLDPRAEPSALLYYNTSSDEDEDEDEDDYDFALGRGLGGRPTKRRLSFKTENRSGGQGTGGYQTARNGSVYSPNSSRVPRPQAPKENSPSKSPSPYRRPGIEEVTDSRFLDRFSNSLGLGSSTDNENVFLTSQRGSARSRQQYEVQSPFTGTHVSGVMAPENTPAGGFANLENMDREALGIQIKKTLKELGQNAETQSIPESIHRLEPLIGGLMGYADSNNLQVQIEFVLEELMNIRAIQPGEVQKLTKLCDRGKTKMKQSAIIARWLAHQELYGANEPITNKIPGWTPISSPASEIRSHTVSPSSPFAFRSPKQQDFSPLQSRTFYASATRSSRRRSDMADSIATLRKKLSVLQSNSEALGEARKLNATREHELFMHYYDQAAGTQGRIKKSEETLDTQLRRLVKEREMQEEAVRQAKLRAEEEARRQEAMRQEAERQRRAAEEAARQRAAEETERRRQEEEEKRRRIQEEAERRVRAEAEHKAQAQRDALMKKEQEDLQKRQEAEARERAVSQAQPVQQPKPVEGATVTSGEYGRKSLEAENAEMRKLLAALKSVRKQVNDNRDLFKQVNAKKRALNPKLGQLNGEVQQTNLVRQFIVSTLTEIKEANAGPMVDAAIFQLNRDPRLQPKPPSQVPVVLIWMINELGKMVVRQVEAESAVSIKTANPIGVAVVSSLAREQLLANGRSFIDIIIARLWKKCPILQGVLGPEDTVGQRQALGWRKTGDQWEGDEPHVNRMVGYVAGFAAIAGRNFMNTQALHNPYPQFNLWFILAHLANNPDKLTNTHFFCIKTMLEVAGETLRRVYGREADKLIVIIFRQLADYGVNKQFAGGFGLKALGSKFEKDKKFL